MNEVKRPYQIAVDALLEIVNPIEKMRERLKEGEQLDGLYAVMLSKDPTYLKSIAEKALQEIKDFE